MDPPEGTTFESVCAVDPLSASRGSESFSPPSAEMSEQTVSKDLSIYVPDHLRPLSDAIRPCPTGIIVDFPDLLAGVLLAVTGLIAYVWLSHKGYCQSSAYYGYV